MAEYEGFCLKCKTYGPIQNVQHYSMANGRKRVGGTCSQPGCTGKISKIVGWFSTCPQRIIHKEKSTPRSVRARGLGVMTSPWHGEDRQFKSGRAHSISNTFEITTFWAPTLDSEWAKNDNLQFRVSKRCTASHTNNSGIWMRADKIDYRYGRCAGNTNRYGRCAWNIDIRKHCILWLNDNALLICLKRNLDLYSK